MRIVINDYAGFSFPLSLSRELSIRGHFVHHLFTSNSGGPKIDNYERTDTLIIKNFKNIKKCKDNYFKRFNQEYRYGCCVCNYLHNKKFDIIISGNTPVISQNLIINFSKTICTPSIFWLQDLLSVAAGSILSRSSRVVGSIVFRYLNRLEISSLNKANHIITITDDFCAYLKRWNIDTNKVSVIPNWGPIEQIPVLPRNNSFSDYHGLNRKFVLLYAGTLGKKQDIRLIADLATKIAHDDHKRFIVATDERGHRLLRCHLNANPPSNLILLPLQSSRQYPYLLASADAILVTLEASAGAYSVPSKLWSSFCAQRPSIVAVDNCNLTARITEKSRAGIVVSPGATDQCIAAMQELKMNPWLGKKMGENARHYAEKHFPINRIADAFENICHKVVNNARENN